MAQTQQGARKQNWLLTGVTVGSIILAILGWTRKVDCACPKDFNATVSSSVKGLGEGLGVPVGARVVDAKGMAIRVGAPPQGAAAPLGRPAAQGVGTGSAAGSTNLTNTRGPLGVGRGIGTTGGVAGGGNFRADGTPLTAAAMDLPATMAAMALAALGAESGRRQPFGRIGRIWPAKFSQRPTGRRDQFYLRRESGHRLDLWRKPVGQHQHHRRRDQHQFDHQRRRRFHHRGRHGHLDRRHRRGQHIDDNDRRHHVGRARSLWSA
jgi:hypothetical protein